MLTLSNARLKMLQRLIETGRSRLRMLDLFGAELMLEQGTWPPLHSPDSALVDVLVLCSACHLDNQTSLELNRPEAFQSLGLAWPGETVMQQVLKALIDAGLMCSLGEGNDGSVENDNPVENERSDDRVLVMSGGRLYLRRVWCQQAFVSTWFARKQKQSVDYATQLTSNAELTAQLKTVIEHLFRLDSYTLQTGGEIDWQAVAAAQALLQKLSLISGGPGTGKTTTAARLLVLSLWHRLLSSGITGEKPMSSCSTLSDLPPLRVRLLAPTGKAAVRLFSSITGQFNSLLDNAGFDEYQRDWLHACLPEEGETIHRALSRIGALVGGDALEPDLHSELKGYKEGASFLRPQTKPLLNADILLVDEASMIDLKLMHDLLMHTPDCQVIFMGDPYQLPPVEIGEVFSDWVSQARRERYGADQADCLAHFLPWDESALNSALTVSDKVDTSSAWRVLTELQKTYRFDGPIYEFACQLRVGDPLHLDALLPIGRGIERLSREPDLLNPAELSWIDLQQGTEELRPQLLSRAFESTIAYYQPYFELLERNASLTELSQEQARFQVLCASYQGALGVTRLNQLIEQRYAGGRELYHGKVIMVTENQVELGLFNGDIGFLMCAENDRRAGGEERFSVFFPDKPGEARSCAFSLVRQWQSAYAISIHKSQGSEYSRVSIFVPDYARDLLSRRLVYTAITRSQSEVELWIGRDSLMHLS